MNRPLRVTVVSPFGEVGGAELWLLRLLDATARLDARVILLRDGPFRQELERRGIACSVVDTGRTGLAVGMANLRLVRRVLETSPDVLLTNGVKAQAAVGPGAWFAGVPTVWVKHDHSYDGALTRLLARLATRVVVTADELAALTGRTRPDILHPPPPDDIATDATAAREQLQALVPQTGPTRTLMMLSRLTPYKGVDRAVEALGQPGAEGWRLVVLGAPDPAEPDERARLTRLAADRGVLDRVHLAGHVPGAHRLLPAADALAVLTRDAGPRTPGREGYGMAAVEAMLAGLPVVAPDDDGPVGRRVREAGAGVLVDADSPASIARALASLDDDQVLHRMRERALSHVSDYVVGAEESARRFSQILSSAARRPGSGLTSEQPVSIVVPVLDERPVIDAVLGPVLAQMSRDDELLVVDSGSRDGTRARVAALAEADARVRLVEVARCTIADSRNHGVRRARHDHVLCTDAGCEVGAGWLDSFRAALAEAPAPPLLVGVFRVEPGRRAFHQAMAAVAWADPAQLRRASLGWRAWTATIGPRFSELRVDGRSVAFSRETFELAGGFRSDLVTAEDEAFGRDAVSAGARPAVVLGAQVTWFQRKRISEAFQQFRGYGRGAAAGGSAQQLAVDGARAAGHLLLLGLVVRNSPGDRRLAGLLAAGVLLYPARRLAQRGHGARAYALLPLAQAVKDWGKLLGDVEGRLGRRTQLRRPG